MTSLGAASLQFDLPSPRFASIFQFRLKVRSFTLDVGHSKVIAHALLRLQFFSLLFHWHAIVSPKLSSTWGTVELPTIVSLALCLGALLQARSIYVAGIVILSCVRPFHYSPCQWFPNSLTYRALPL
jgi:hypothetical protein